MSSPRKRQLNILLVLIFTLAATVFFLAGVRQVPFHPDESTQIFMSSDVDLFLQNPRQVFWSPEKENDLRQHYRLLDAPLTRSLIWLGRTLSGEPPLRADWDWSKTWSENEAAGALPGVRLLLVARLSVALFFPFTLMLVYRTAALTGGWLAGWAAMLLVAFHPLILLHTRRAMAESVLVFTSCLSMWAMLTWKRRPYLAALPLALAFNAKQLAVLLLVPALFALWHHSQAARPRQRLTSLVFFAGIFGLVSFLLNPFLWQSPFPAAAKAWRERSAFTQTQVQTFLSGGSTLPQSSLPDRLAAEIVQLYLAPPAAADTGNYLAETAPSTQTYFRNPLHNLNRGLAAGGISLALTLFGLAAGLRTAIHAAGEQRWQILFLAASTIWLFILTGLMLPIPFQRYFIALIPYVSIWSGVSLAFFVRAITTKRGSKPEPASSRPI